MSKIIKGAQSTTPNNLLLGPGAFFKGYEITTDTPSTAMAKCIGATQGGGSFSAIPQIRKYEFDGVNPNTKGYADIDYWDVKMAANVGEVTLNSLKIALGAVTESAPTSPTGYKKVVGKDKIESGDYVTNLTWVGTLSGNAKPVIIVIKNAFSEKGLTLNFDGKKESVIPIELTGNYEVNSDTPPFEIYYPAA